MNTLGTRRSHQYWWSEKSWYVAIWFGCETIMHSGAYQEIIYSAKNESHVASPTLYNKIKTCQAKNSTLLIKSGFFSLALCKYQKHLRDYNSLFTLRLLGNLTQATTSGSKKNWSGCHSCSSPSGHLRLPPKSILMANFRREINMFTPLYRKQFWYPYSSYYSLFEKTKQNRLKGLEIGIFGGIGCVDRYGYTRNSLRPV